MTACKQCLIDSTMTPVFTLDENGICNYCNYYYASVKALGPAESRRQKLEEILKEIKLKGKNREYDCLLGVSGGVDSSYLAYLCHKYELRPLVVHFDNGWNSELAVKNIETILKKLNYSLYTYVINWNEFKDIQVAYLKAGVIDMEAITDHAIYATILKIARKKKIDYVLSGFNLATEAIMPKGWTWKKEDWRNIKDIHRTYGKGPIKSFPHLTFTQKLFYNFVHQLKPIPLLNYIDYNKDEAKSVLIDQLGWVDYGGKHFESVFTRFYQSYILPVKFNVDKRVAHLSSLIVSGQISREQALEELKKPILTEAQFEEDKIFVLKKLDIPESTFNDMMRQKPVAHTNFKTEDDYWDVYFGLIKKLKKLLPKK